MWQKTAQTARLHRTRRWGGAHVYDPRDGSATRGGLPPNTFKYYCIVTVYCIAINTNAGGLRFWRRDCCCFC